MNIKSLSNNPIEKGTEVCIFGTGKNACLTYIECVQHDISVRCFVDRNDSPAIGRELYCKKIISEKEYIKNESNLIIASKFWRDICQRLEKEGIREVYVDYERYSSSVICNDVLLGIGDFLFSKEKYYIVCPYGLGDTLYVASLVKELKKQHEISTVCMVVKKSHVAIINMFDSIDEVIASDILVEKLNVFSVATETWQLKNYLYGHFKKNIQQINFDEYDEKKYSMVDLYKKFVMKLSDSSCLDMISYSKCNSKIQISNNSIILAPYAHTAKQLPIEFWEKVAKIFTDNGFEVYTNVAKNETSIKGTKELRVGLEDVPGCVEKSRFVLAIRSGLCDVLAFTKAKLIVIETDQGLTNCWRLNDIRNDIIYLKSYDKNEDELIQSIVGCVL